jgi:hypothetical protein
MGQKARSISSVPTTTRRQFIDSGASWVAIQNAATTSWAFPEVPSPSGLRGGPFVRF